MNARVRPGLYLPAWSLMPLCMKTRLRNPADRIWSLLEMRYIRPRLHCRLCAVCLSDEMFWEYLPCDLLYMQLCHVDVKDVEALINILTWTVFCCFCIWRDLYRQSPTNRALQLRKKERSHLAKVKGWKSSDKNHQEQRDTCTTSTTGRTLLC